MVTAATDSQPSALSALLLNYPVEVHEQIMHEHVHTYPSSGNHIFAQDTHSLVSVAAGSTDMWVPMTCSSWR